MDEFFKKPEDDNEAQDQTKRDDPYASVRRESEPYTFGPFGANQAKPSISEAPNSDQPHDIVVPGSVTREYRPFTVSGGVERSQFGSKPPRRTSLRSAFAAFLVGVLAVGALMYSADRYNWFSDDIFGGTTKAATEADVKAASNPVSNASDVVRPNNIAKIFEQSSPAVVQIETYANSRSSAGNLWQDDFFRQFFGDDYGQDNGGEDGSLQQSGMGSGFIFDSTGYILTNQHVIADAAKIKVIVDGYEQPFTAELLGSSYELDLAVLKIKGSDFPTLKLGDSGSMNMGDWVVAIGNPYGFDHTVTVGVLSSNEREISIPDSNGTRNYKHLLQTDASINPGNSGGPLINLLGEVIGINTAVSSQAQGIGFAIPTSTIKDVLENLKSNTKIPQKPVPFIGATLQDVTPQIAERLGIDAKTKGSFVREVLFNTPAYKADLRQYDVITGMDDKSYDTSAALIEAIKTKTVGDKVTLHLIRGDKKLDIAVTIGDRNEFETQH
ncbi:S1C family serine protease [Cohnella panacarvi]|uniref:S1C family serine protease n=1 Tax=Cohnella panacarvi TaxID=400776 RepID=UPI00047B37A9|nr:trypsin-like peptidase domain-containing protein [Cohnella panacarvi]